MKIAVVHMNAALGEVDTNLRNTHWKYWSSNMLGTNTIQYIKKNGW